jgi:hypothetical protein
MNNAVTNHQVLRTALTPEQCQTHLEAHLYVYRPLRWSHRSLHPVCGQVSTTGFSLRQRALFAHTLSPAASGLFERTADGTRVTVCWSAQRRLTVLWLGICATVLLLAVMTLAPSLAEVRRHGLFALAPFMGFLGASLGSLMLAGFLYARRRRRAWTFLRQFLRIHLHAEEVNPSSERKAV